MDSRYYASATDYPIDGDFDGAVTGLGAGSSLPAGTGRRKVIPASWAPSAS